MRSSGASSGRRSREGRRALAAGRRRAGLTGDMRTFCTVQKQSSLQLVRLSLLPSPCLGRRLSSSKAAGGGAAGRPRGHRQSDGGRQAAAAAAAAWTSSKRPNPHSTATPSTCAPILGAGIPRSPPFLAWATALCRIVAAAGLQVADRKDARVPGSVDSEGGAAGARREGGGVPSGGRGLQARWFVGSVQWQQLDRRAGHRTPSLSLAAACYATGSPHAHFPALHARLGLFVVQGSSWRCAGDAGQGLRRAAAGAGGPGSAPRDCLRPAAAARRQAASVRRLGPDGGAWRPWRRAHAGLAAAGAPASGQCGGGAACSAAPGPAGAGGRAGGAAPPPQLAADVLLAVPCCCRFKMTTRECTGGSRGVAACGAALGAARRSRRNQRAAASSTRVESGRARHAPLRQQAAAAG